MIRVAQIGNGFVGSALHKSFEKKNIKTIIYDKYQGIGSIDTVTESRLLFLCLPTPYVDGYGFDLSAITENLKILASRKYSGLVIIKSTVEPGITEKLSKQFPNLYLCHNPEFLTARTAEDDFHNQKHIVLGFTRKVLSEDISMVDDLFKFYSKTYPQAKVSVCKSEESEAMKLFCNNFYAIKIQIFNEFYYLAQKVGIDFENVKEMMLQNGWINPMHTDVPGHDGLPSFGGACFPKDTNALHHMMKTLGTPSEVLGATIAERNKMREFKLK